ncbi:MAG: helix-turn-helix domain-containing protein [Lachnospiraceae bacterium]
MKTVSDRIFELLKERGMSQKEFAQRTGIAESSISDWKRKRTNPVSDKILIISEVLGVSPYYLLSGAEHSGERSRENRTYVISKDTELGVLVETYQRLDKDMQKRLMGYMEALAGLEEPK